MLRKEFRLASRSVSTRCLHALLFGESLPVDDPEVRNLLTNSVLTNTVTDFEDNTTIKPQTCSMALFEALKSDESPSKTAKMLCDMLETLLSSLYDPRVLEGNALEVILRGMFAARLTMLGELAEKERKKQRIPLHKLLLMNSVGRVRNLTPKATKLLETKFKISRLPEEEFSLSRSNDLTNERPPSEASADFFEDAQKFRVSKDSPCVKLNLDPFEFGDSGWLLKTRMGAFGIIFDAKSRDMDENDLHEHKKDPIERKSYRLPKNGSQAKHFERLCKLAKKGKEEADPFSLIGAMQRGNYLFVYVNTNTNLPSFMKGDHVLNLGGEESAKFLSYMYDYYVLHRVVPEKTKK